MRNTGLHLRLSDETCKQLVELRKLDLTWTDLHGSIAKLIDAEYQRMKGKPVDEQQRIAFVNAQVLCASIEFAAMQLENKIAENEGKELPHSPDAFRTLTASHMIGWNDVIGYFTGR